MEPDTPAGRAEREPPGARAVPDVHHGDALMVRVSFAALVEAARPRTLRELVDNPALRRTRPREWLCQVYVHVGVAFSALTAWCDDPWLEACIDGAVRACSGGALPPEQLLAASEPHIHPAVLEVLAAEVFGQAAPSVLISPGLPWDIAVRRATFERLVDRSGPSMVSYARLVWGFAPADARALVDATLDAAWREFGRLHPRSDFVPWLAARVRSDAARGHLVARGVRRGTDPPHHDAGEVPYASAADAQGPEPAWDREADLAVRALGRLSPSLRECLVLADVAGLTREQIAATLAIPSARVRARIRAARRRFTEVYAALAASSVTGTHGVRLPGGLPPLAGPIMVVRPIALSQSN